MANIEYLAYLEVPILFFSAGEHRPTPLAVMLHNLNRVKGVLLENLSIPPPVITGNINAFKHYCCKFLSRNCAMYISTRAYAEYQV